MGTRHHIQVAETTVFGAWYVGAEQSHGAQMPSCPSCPQSLGNWRVDATKKDNH